MGVPLNTSWEKPEGLRRSPRTFQRIIRSRPAVAVLPLIAAILLLPSLLSYTGSMMGIPLRGGVETQLWNLALAVVAGLVLLYYAGLQSDEKAASRLRLTIDCNGLAESGYKKEEQNWNLSWEAVSRVQLAGDGVDQVLRIFTIDSGDRPGYLLFDYPFEELTQEMNYWLAQYNQGVEIAPELSV